MDSASPATLAVEPWMPWHSTLGSSTPGWPDATLSLRPPSCAWWFTNWTSWPWRSPTSWLHGLELRGRPLVGCPRAERPGTEQDHLLHGRGEQELRPED